MISQILVPIDGSDTAKKAAEYAFGLARLCGAKVVLLSVLDTHSFVGRPLVPASRAPANLFEPIEDFLKEDAEFHLSEAEELARNEGIPITKRVVQGHAVEEIVKQAETSGADLIVLGSHGRSAFRAALLGSVAYGVIHKDTHIPVLVVRK